MALLMIVVLVVIVVALFGPVFAGAYLALRLNRRQGGGPAAPPA